MNNNVVQLHPVKEGDSVFIMCPCDREDPAPYIVQVVVSTEPLVQGLMCPKCRTYLPVVNGIIQKDRQ